MVQYQADQQVFLNDPKNPLAAISNPPRLFVPARDFLLSLQDPPTGSPLKLPWIGVPQLTGLKKDVAEYFGLKDQPAVEVGDIVPHSPGDKAGLKPGQIIVKLNGKPLERGDEPEEIPQILRRNIVRMKVGAQITLSVLPEKGAPLRDITIALEEQPRRATTAKRFFAEDLGFVAREIVFYDTYFRRLPADTKGVIIALLKPQGSAQSARLEANDLVTELNGESVANLDQFRSAYAQYRKAHPHDAVVLVVIREAKTQTIRIEPPQ